MTITDKHVLQITQNLQDFGYTDLTSDFVEEKVKALIRGEKPTDIIGMMTMQMLEENGLL